MASLSLSQQAALRFARVSKVSFSLFCEVGDMNRIATIKALQKRGLVEYLGGRYWLTEEGEKVRHRLIYGVCECCGSDTDKNETVCLQCGFPKTRL